MFSRVRAIDLPLATAKREGSKKAGEMFGSVAISTLQPKHPMDGLQIDHTPVNVIVVDQQKRRLIGRRGLLFPSTLEGSLQKTDQIVR